MRETEAQNGNFLQENAVKSAFSFAVLAFALLMGSAVWGQTAEEYQAWMKSNGAAVADLNKNLAAKNASAAIMDANTIQENISKTMIYWQIKKVPDALKFASGAKEGFANVIVLVNQGKFDEAGAAAKTAQTNCGGCHMAHREKAADGSFKIK
jgi:hypothetical protein